MNFQLKPYVDGIVGYVQANQEWAAPIVFALSFAESLAFLSILIPSTAIMLALGALFGASGIAIFPIWVAAVAGSVLGYALSYWIGLYFKDDMHRVWPFSANPKMLDDGRVFFDKYGSYGVFLGHLIGPFRAVVPVIAGMYSMPQLPFQAANVAASVVWATFALLPSYYGLDYMKGWMG